ncbi:MAG: response regulator transcription factor [Phycisphaerae bacterium]|nr:response regulator transcription factor [Phycisphaerae bacterium]
MCETKILLVEEYALIRRGLRLVLEDQSGLSVVGEAVDGQDALRLVGLLNPELAILPIFLPGLNGIDLCRQIRRNYPKTRVIALAMPAERHLGKKMFEAGASGCLLKSCNPEDLHRAIREVMRGNTFICPHVAGQFVADSIYPAASDGEADPLTSRERQVLQLLAEGKTTKQAAQMLHLSAKTIESHRRNIMQKLDRNNLAELTRYAIRTNLVSLED